MPLPPLFLRRPLASSIALASLAMSSAWRSTQKLAFRPPETRSGWLRNLFRTMGMKVRWNLQGIESFQGFLGGAGFRPGTVLQRAKSACHTTRNQKSGFLNSGAKWLSQPSTVGGSHLRGALHLCELPGSTLPSFQRQNSLGNQAGVPNPQNVYETGSAFSEQALNEIPISAENPPETALFSWNPEPRTQPLLCIDLFLIHTTHPPTHPPKKKKGRPPDARFGCHGNPLHPRLRHEPRLLLGLVIVQASHWKRDGRSGRPLVLDCFSWRSRDTNQKARGFCFFFWRGGEKSPKKRHEHKSLQLTQS